ncbi:MAG: hypothetical protein FWG73_03860 [Planctomycetaceae bacterium]|nr:hypothetical protein [Planctomycetaceae bacterium]
MSKTQRIYLSGTIITLLVLFYVYSSLSSRPARTPRFDVPFDRFTGAEQLRSARSPELIEEVRKLIEQNGLPVDVFHGLAATSEEDILWQQELQQNNIAATLHEYFETYYRPDPRNELIPLRDDLQKLWEASPIGAWHVDWGTNPVGVLDIDAEKLNNTRQMSLQFEAALYSIRNKLDQPGTIFYYVFEREADAASYTGTTVNTLASKYLADYALLEEYDVALALLAGDIDDAIDSLAYMFRIAYLASRLEDVGTRADSVIVRLRAYDVMQRVILDPKFERRHMTLLRNILTEQYQNWNPEHMTWFGDRAAGLMMYRRIMIGGPLDALEQNDIDELEGRGLMLTFNRNFRQNHEQDTAFYLQTMQKVLDISQKPYVNRIDVLNQINRELQVRRDTYNDSGISTEPVVASILLRDVDRLMYLFAQDQSALTRALVAMLHSLGQRNTSGYRNPFTNEPYAVRQVDGFFSIEVPELPRPFRVPIFVE